MVMLVHKIVNIKFFFYKIMAISDKNVIVILHVLIVQIYLSQLIQCSTFSSSFSLIKNYNDFYLNESVKFNTVSLLKCASRMVPPNTAQMISFNKERKICYLKEYCIKENKTTLIHENGWRNFCQNDALKDCQPGTYLNDTKCEKCDAGFYNNLTNQVNCTACPPGQYQDRQGQTCCLPCPDNMYQDLEGQSECKMCISGNGSDWRKINDQKTKCVGCWYAINTYTEGDNSKIISQSSVPNRDACYTKCQWNLDCLSIKATSNGKWCTLFTSKHWEYGYVYDSVVCHMRGLCLAGR